MALLSVLRETLRSDLDDVIRLSKDRMFENEVLEAALFQGLQQHNKKLTWLQLPQEEEQLVLILAKSKIAWDRSLAYALDTKVLAGQGFARTKVENAGLLKEIAQELREEYKTQRTAIENSQAETGDITVGTLTRTSLTTRTKVPAQSAIRPGKLRVTSAKYMYDASIGQGTVSLEWSRPQDMDLAFIKVIISQKQPVQLSDTVIRTLYDVYIDPLAIPPVPPLPQQNGTIAYTILPTGRWYLVMVSFNWNRLYTMSDPVALDVSNYVNVAADTLVLQG